MCNVTVLLTVCVLYQNEPCCVYSQCVFSLGGVYTLNLMCINCCVCRGTHGYMAPEVLQKGTAYDSSADWFSLGCMLFKLLRG